MSEIQIIFQAIIVIIGFYLAFFKSYFQEKGKNIATKEDIEEITKKVEGIKNDLLYSTQFKINLKIEERNSLVDCYEKLSLWINSVYETNFGGISLKNQEKLRDVVNAIDNIKMQFELSNSRMELFINNKQITDKFFEVREKALAMHLLIYEYQPKLRMLFLEESKAMRITSGEEKINAIKLMYEKEAVLFEQLKDDIITIYKEIVPLESELQGLIYNHLQNLVERN